MVLVKVRHFCLRVFVAIIALIGMIHYFLPVRNRRQDIVEYTAAIDVAYSDINDSNIHLVDFLNFRNLVSSL